MSDKLLAHIRRYIPLSDAECNGLVEYFVYRRLRKKELALRAGKTCDRLYFVARGCVRGYFVDESGAEKTAQLAIEGWWITDFQAFLQRHGTGSYYQAVESSDVFSITHAAYQRMLTEHPVMERYFRLIYEIAYAASINRIKYLFAYSKEDMFFHFREHYPDFVNRVPQYILATFLGLTPEYLSKLRAKRFS